MKGKKYFWVAASFIPLLLPHYLMAETISIEGAPGDTGYNAGSVATIRATLRGISGDASRYAVFAGIEYVGATSEIGVQMERQPSGKPAEDGYEAAWPIPADAPTGLYSVIVRVEDRSTHEIVATKKLRSFAIYKKLVRISRVKLNKTFYSAGEPIECEVALENLTDQDFKDLRLEFSNANYPWISLFSKEISLAGQPAENPELSVKVLRDHLSLPARGEAAIPMTPAGTAAFLQGAQVAVLGAGGPARHEKIPPPEVNFYTIAVWKGDRSVLYDMQFSAPAIVRAWDRDLPKPYVRSFTHPYNSDIDFTKYRQFYAPGQVSSVIRLDHSRTLFRPGDPVNIHALLKNSGECSWKGLELGAEIIDPGGNVLRAATLLGGFDIPPGETREVRADAWTLPESLASGIYKVRLSLADSSGKKLAQTASEIAVNALPVSLLVMTAHEDDEHAYAGLIRAAIEAGIPVRVVTFTGGDVGACERYYLKACGPNEAREFGLVRMEETAEALDHLGLTREKVTFLGLPDGGSGAIWSSQTKTSDPFLSIYLATDHAPYENVLQPNLPYTRDAVIDLIKKILREFRPAMIATPHPDERHVDHRTVNWFAIKACQELLKEKQIDPQTMILADQAYGPGGYKPAPYNYEKAKVFLSGEAAALKQEMSWIYQSQDGNLDEGMKRSFAELPRQEIHYRILDWQEHTGWNE